MRILPVIDLKGGVVVRGIAGRREEYRPIVSRLTPSTNPADIARAFRDQLGLRECYVADLDAIAGSEPAFAVAHDLQALGFQIALDAGVRDVASADRLAGAGIDRIVVGLETLAGPEELGRILGHLGPDRVVFSLDLRAGQPVGDVRLWARPEAYAIARQAVDLGAKALIVLDLARVGMAGGIGTEDLCRRLHQAHPEVEWIAGGGIRGRNDVRRLEDCGVDAVLVASALHDGRLP